MKDENHVHHIDLAMDTVNDEGERDRWACTKCGQQIAVDETPTSPLVYLFMGWAIALTSIFAAVVVLKII